MAADSFKITLAQLNPTAGDIAGNAAKVREARAKAATDGADLVVLPELFLSGGLAYDVEPLCRAAIEALAHETADSGPAVLIGTPWADDGKLHDAMALLDAGRIAATRFKINLADGHQQRLFTRGPAAGPVSVRGVRIGIAIGEDIWPEALGGENVVETLAETGAELILVAAAARYVLGEGDRRLSAAVARVTESDLPLIWLNLTGGQGDDVFDGASFALNADLSMAVQLPAFVDDVSTLAWRRGNDGWQCRGPVSPLIDGEEADYAARVLGLRDRVAKGGLTGVVLELTADVEAALSLAIAVDALGPAQVRAVMLSGPDTQAPDEAIAAATRLGVAAEVVPIAAAVAGFENILAGPLSHSAHDDLLTSVRATLLKAMASLSGALACRPLQGSGRQTCDVTSGELIRLAALRNRWKPVGALGASGEVIPPDLIDRAPRDADQG
ncbi:putative glutamine-dependent NAD(+) synthetase (NadE-like) [Bradyrhizobium sp. ORS 278]|uniref:nitrilase-related carbon-nitrogen hydrolase n=1 Tax=Bradyrhizobium sp. (strain ORS 278) TaxID=114615 RepID=UPI000150815E|nr:nitrilase-related carbon-nitrogen hydrolase [Bradyrhizobium sp. ORS 278]CAL78432.1 putative glutamine-dependent NAD(+) synthetase (NadE-like) [Bradyrhizobium sp. ORS 278]